MKNTFIILVFISIGMPFLRAQTNRFDLGIEGGPNLSTFRDKPSFNVDSKVFFSGGVSFQYNSRKIFSLRTGLYYQKKGYQQELKDISTFGKVYFSTQVTSNYHYLTLPVLARVSFGEKVKFFINAGPYVSYLLSQRISSKLIDVPVHANNNKQVNGIKDWDLGIAAGAGIAVPVKSWIFSLEVRNYLGILNTHVRNYQKTEYYTITGDLNIGIARRLKFRGN